MHRRVRKPLAAAALAAALPAAPALAGEPLEVRITPSLESVTVIDAGEPVTIQRNQDQTSTITPAFARTSRRCPPFCIQPMQMPSGVETIGELEMLDYLRRASDGDDSVLVIDSRGADWLARGTIPGSVDIHYKRLSMGSADESAIAEILTDQFGAERYDHLWNFQFAKTLVLFCNGPWCGQSPSNIRALLRFGYPPGKIKWYRGGMQDWENLGFSTVTRGEATSKAPVQ
jgi:rhodanese-related sulfurtransferase